jgi:putative ABC transport system permease protein
MNPRVPGELAELGPFDTLIALQLLLYAVILAFSVGVPLGKTIAIGAVRAFVQLSLMGIILGYLFQTDSPAIVVLVLLVMILFAADEARRRAKKRVPGDFVLMAVAIGAGVVLTGSVAVFLVIRPTPFLAARTAIPILGLIVGASLTGSTLALERLVSEIELRRHEIETALALGATPAQAVRQAVREAFRAAMVPPLNHLMVVGIVHIPGTMTGLMLAGKDPKQGALYQLMISFSIVCCVSVTSAVTTILGYRRLFTERAQLRNDLLGR